MKKTKQKRVEAWVALDKDGRVFDWDETKGALEQSGLYDGKPIVHLVERDPTAEAVVRAVRELISSNFHLRENVRGNVEIGRVARTVERYEKKHGKKK